MPPAERSGSRRSITARRPRVDDHARESAISVVVGLAVYALGLLTGPLLARALGPSGRGDLAAVVVPAQLFVWVAALGMPSACAFHLRRWPPGQLLRATAVIVGVVGVPVTGALWLLVPAFLDDHADTTVPWLRLLLIDGLVGVLALCLLEMRRISRGADLRYNLSKHLAIVLNALGIGALFALDRLTLGSALAAMAASQVIGQLVQLTSMPVRLERHLPWREPIRSLVSYGSRVAVGTWSNTIVSRLDQLVLVGLVPSRELGIYAVAVSAANVTIPVGQGIASAMLPELRRSRATTVGPILRRSLLLSAGVTTTIAALVAVAAPVLIPAAFGGDFRPAVWPLWLLLPGQIAYDLAQVLKSSLSARGHPGKDSAAQVVAAAVTLLVMPPAIATWGLGGAAVATSLSYVTMLLTALRFHRSIADGAPVAAIDAVGPT